MTDGIVSRYVNRRLSRPLAAGLARTPVTPNGATRRLLAASCWLLVRPASPQQPGARSQRP